MSMLGIEALAAIDSVSQASTVNQTDYLKITSTQNAGEVMNTDQANFADWLGDQVGQVDSDMKTADHELQKLALGKAENLHEVMISMEKAKMQFELIVQVRNRLLEAYQEVSRMQI